MEKTFDIERIKLVANKYSSHGKPTVTNFYEWGHWVNGGAWIKTGHGKLDFLYIYRAVSFSEKNDLFNIMGCFTRADKNIVASAFAINELHPPGDKRAIEVLEKTTSKPTNFKEKIEQILCAQKDRTGANLTILKALFDETVSLMPGLYNPFYIIDHN